MVTAATKLKDAYSLMMKVKGESEKAGLNLNIQKTKIMASGPITSWQIEGEKVDEKDPRPGPLFEGNPEGEGTTRRGTDTNVHRPQRPSGPHKARRGA